MKIRDEALWLQVRMDLATDGEAGKAMESFVTDWCTRAEYALEQGREFGGVRHREFAQNDREWTEMDPMSALRAALPAAEITSGMLSFSALTQALIIVMGIWEFGEGARDHLGVIERRAVMEMAAMKTAEIERQAQGVSPSPQ